MSKSREQINKFLSEIDLTDKKVLDVGCQDNLARKYTKGIPSEYHTADIDKQWNPDFIVDLNDNSLFFAVNSNRYDVVFCLEVLEHCWNPRNVLANLFDVLKGDGVAYISVPFINPIHDLWDYLRYTPEWFDKVLPMVGFKQWEIKLRKSTEGREELINFYQKEGLRLSKVRQQMGDSDKLDLIGLFIKAEK